MIWLRSGEDHTSLIQTINLGCHLKSNYFRNITHSLKWRPSFFCWVKSSSYACTSIVWFTSWIIGAISISSSLSTELQCCLHTMTNKVLKYTLHLVMVYLTQKCTWTPGINNLQNFCRHLQYTDGCLKTEIRPLFVDNCLDINTCRFYFFFVFPIPTSSIT